MTRAAVTAASVPAIVPISRHFGRLPRTWPFPPAEATAAIDPAEKIDPIDPAEPIENAEAIEPTLPIDSAEPVEPIDSTEPSLNSERTESRECTDNDIRHLSLGRQGFLYRTSTDIAYRPAPRPFC
jgi:hypothetical protein